MKKVKIKSDEQNIDVECPHCRNWEQIGIDQQRHRLNNLPIVRWDGEESVHLCTDCMEKFQVEWDYENKF